jgi:Mg2+ and Co2+ transporter CorA
MPESSIKVHANCGIGELARGLVFEVLPKTNSRASMALIPPPCTNQAEEMESTIRYLTTVALIAVLAVLLAGLWNMMRGTSPNLSQTLMRWRVGLQFLAIVIAMILVYFLRS